MPYGRLYPIQFCIDDPPIFKRKEKLQTELEPIYFFTFAIQTVSSYHRAAGWVQIGGGDVCGFPFAQLTAVNRGVILSGSGG